MGFSETPRDRVRSERWQSLRGRYRELHGSAVTTLGAVTTVAGSTSICGYAGIYPSGIAYDSTDGNLYVTNEALCNVDQIMMNGTITSIAGNAGIIDFSVQFRRRHVYRCAL